MSAAAAAGTAKRRDLAAFCRHPRCLWRTLDEWCPRHVPLPPDVELDLHREAARDEVECQVDEEYDAMRRWEAST